ncbi:MAG: NAD(P)H-hydrate dehydratase [Syntrophomonadaceae bacterium]|nr:NAD(P)H-hydrate dehydratase [Syntrophomonadaceae bacterium]
MKLLYAEQMKDIDRKATEDYLIPSLLLMENAGLKVLETIKHVYGNLSRARITILAGKGNNGGDGLVLGRHLLNAGAAVDIFLLGDPQNLSRDARVNYLILEQMQANIYPLNANEHFDFYVTKLLSSGLIVDAIYGIGFRGSLDDFETRVVQMVNLSSTPVVAVDIASGVEADTGEVHGTAIKADYTVTFARPKLGQYLEPGQSYTGKLIIADISIPLSLLEHESLKLNLIDQELVGRFITPRRAESHKGSYGHVLVIGGSAGMSGAVIMASCAALRSGAGLVTAALPGSLVPVLEGSTLEVMSRPLAETMEASISSDALPALGNLLENVSVCAIGPGMSRYREANAILRYVLENSGVPVLIDADGLNALEGDAGILKDRQVPVVITPHPGEMSRLTGLPVADIQSNRLGIARQYAVDWGITVVLKGNKTVVASPTGEVFVNTSGNPGMATAGSGDVLSGIIAGLIAQGLKPRQAAVAGVYIHGCSGDKAAELRGQRGLIAGDLIDQLPAVLKNFENINKS